MFITYTGSSGGHYGSLVGYLAAVVNISMIYFYDDLFHMFITCTGSSGGHYGSHGRGFGGGREYFQDYGRRSGGYGRHFRSVYHNCVLSRLLIKERWFSLSWM